MDTVEAHCKECGEVTEHILTEDERGLDVLECVECGVATIRLGDCCFEDPT